MMFRYERPAAIIWQIKEGISPESKTIQDLLISAREHSRQPISQSWQTFLKDQVREVSNRCSQVGWDGYNANPISRASMFWALKLIDQLPENVQEPQIVPEPDGEIALEWNSGKDMLFSLTASGSKLIYGGIMGSNHKLYGQEQFFNELPQTIANTLSNYFFKV